MKNRLNCAIQGFDLTRPFQCDRTLSFDRPLVQAFNKLNALFIPKRRMALLYTQLCVRVFNHAWIQNILRR